MGEGGGQEAGGRGRNIRWSFHATSVDLSPAQCLSPATRWPKQVARGLWECSTDARAAGAAPGGPRSAVCRDNTHSPWAGRSPVRPQTMAPAGARVFSAAAFLFHLFPAPVSMFKLLV